MAVTEEKIIAEESIAMTESEWLSFQDPQKMLLFLRDSGRFSERKARLFACAAVRRI
jgi:hypothetical protein